MLNKEQVKELLFKSFRKVYCEICRYNNEKDIDDYCDYCYRKFMNWGISESYAEQIAKEIMEN